MTRRRITAALRVRVWDRNGGLCHLCGLPIDHIREPWEIEHPKAIWLGGLDDEMNMKPAHIDCHSRKTRDEAPLRAKGTRVRARHLGIRKPATFRGWRKFNGDVVINPKIKRAR